MSEARDRESVYARFERAVELPMLALATVFAVALCCRRSRS